MDKTAIREIAEMAKPNIVVEGGYRYTDKQLMVIKEPRVGNIQLATLASLADMLIEEINEFRLPVIVHVISPTEVRVMSGIGESDRTREYPYTAKAETPEFGFGMWYSYEEMMIALKSKFVETSELAEVVKLLGTITDENNMTIADDGFTQTVTVRKGVVLKEGKAINPRVKLKPYCTFNEVEQPERELLLRLSGGGDVALFEADGGAWKLEARHNIAVKLKEMFAEYPGIHVVE